MASEKPEEPKRQPKTIRKTDRATVGDIAAVLDALAPPELAEPWDNVGLLLGDPGAEPRWAAVALEAAFALAGDQDVLPPGPGLLVVHHPVPFRPRRRLVAGDAEGGLLLELARRRVALYAAHTNYDAAPGGLSHLLAVSLGLSPRGLRALRPSAVPPGGGSGFYKLVVFVPSTHTDRVRAALAAAGAGWIGDYSDTAFAAPGRGYFRPREGAEPFIGSVGNVEEVHEDRLETIVPAHRLRAVLGALTEAHPYEEPAYDVYRLETHPPVTRAELIAGTGRVGELAAGPMELEAFRAWVEEKLALPAGRARLVGWAADADRRTVHRVAVCPGAGGDLVEAAAAAGADVYITGDVGYHRAVEAFRLGLPLIDAGHLGTEKAFVPAVARALADALADQGISLPLIEVPSPPGWRW